MIVRFDDICANSDMSQVNAMAARALDRGYTVWYAISPLCHSDAENQRVFPRLFKALSDHRIFYRPDTCGVPCIPHDVGIASHGLIHVDHRLLDWGAQELSIVASCAMLHTRRFVPPFNKWNTTTEAICRDNDIDLIKFESGWLSAEHNLFDPSRDKYYLHHRAFTVGGFAEWLQ
jgi:hypothetical protein